jgi:hypothetical protein
MQWAYRLWSAMQASHTLWAEEEVWATVVAVSLQMLRAMFFNLYPNADASLIAYDGANTTRHLASMYQYCQYYAMTLLNGRDLLVCGGMQRTPNVYHKQRMRETRMRDIGHAHTRLA